MTDDVEATPMPNDAEAERKAIVAWLRDAPFPWINRKASLWHRILAAWTILRHGEGPIRGLCQFLALKVERGDHREKSSG